MNIDLIMIKYLIFLTDQTIKADQCINLMEFLLFQITNIIKFEEIVLQ